MGICKKKIINIILCLFFIFFFTNFVNGEQSFEQFNKKKVSYLDFFLLKFENTLVKRADILRRQMVPTRVQYSNIGMNVNFDKKREEISVNIYAVMDKQRYAKKRYKQKISDCNQIRNLIFYQKHGYKFFTQKRDPSLSKNLMEEIFIDVFFNNLSFNKKEMSFLLDKMFVYVTIFHPLNKKELSCKGKVNDYLLN